MARRSASLAPSQSASRQEMRKRGRPSLSSRLRIASNGVRTSEVPALTSSSPSMNSVFPCHSGWLLTENVMKSRAVIRMASSPTSPLSTSKAVDLPAPGSPSRTYAGLERNSFRGRDFFSPR